jgi:hypothetical protein
LQKFKARAAAQKSGLFAAFWYDLWKQIDHAIVGSIDAARNVAGAKNRGFHQ